MIRFEETGWLEETTKVTFSVRVKIDGVEVGDPITVVINKPITPTSVTSALKTKLGSQAHIVVLATLQKLANNFEAT